MLDRRVAILFAMLAGALLGFVAGMVTVVVLAPPYKVEWPAGRCVEGVALHFWPTTIGGRE